MVFYYAAVEAGDAGARPYKKKCFSNLFLVNVYNFNSKIIKILIFLK
jgi:hypothetical protein